MPLITQCTVCGAQFKIVRDQLKIAGGWVRCGQCDEVFKAVLYVSDEPPAPAPQHVTATPAPSVETEAPTATDRANESPEERRARRRARLQERQERRLKALADKLAAENEAQAHPVTHAYMASDVPVFDEPAIPAAPSASTVDAQPLAIDAHSPIDAFATRAPALPSVDASALNPSFVPKPRRTWPWVIAALLLILALVAQWGYQQRDALIAMAPPAWRTALQPLCARIGCNNGPPREVGSVVIDGSAFTRLDATSFRMALTLRNHATHVVATPSVEVTLTNADDRAVLRRVLPPQQMGAPAALGASAEWSEPLRLSLPEASAAQVVGYRVLAFYP